MLQLISYKWWWRWRVEQTALWVRVVSAIHKQQGAWSYMPIKAGFASVWGCINKIDQSLTDRNINVRDLIKADLKNGVSVRFWLDCWADCGPLIHRFPSLFALESRKDVSVAERLTGWSWRRDLVTSSEQLQFAELTDLVSSVRLSSEADKWVWKGSTEGLFSVASCRKLLSQFAAPFAPFDWIKHVPRKVSIFAWRAEQNRLPTLLGLQQRRILNGSATCRLCGSAEEDSEHLFSSCYVSAVVLDKVSAWCKISQVFAFCVRDLLNVHKSLAMENHKRKWVRLIIVGAAWAIWKARNAHIFSGKRVCPQSVFAKIQSTTYLWAKNKCKTSTWTWADWVGFNIPIT